VAGEHTPAQGRALQRGGVVDAEPACSELSSASAFVCTMGRTLRAADLSVSVHKGSERWARHSCDCERKAPWEAP